MPERPPVQRSKMSFLATYLHGEAVMQSSNLVARGVGLVNSFLILTALSVYQFGLYQLVLAAIAIADSVSTGFFDDVVLNDIARGLAERKRERAKRIFQEFAIFKIGCGFLLALALVLGAEILASYYDADIGSYVRIASFLVIARAVLAVVDALFLATVSRIGFARAAVEEVAKLLFLSLFFFQDGFGITEVLFAAVGAAGVSVLVIGWAFVGVYQRHLGGVSAERAFLLREISASYGASIYLRYGFAKIGKYIRPWLVRFFLNTEAVAIYTFAVHLLTLAQAAVPVGVLGRMLPWHAADHPRLAFIVSRSLKYTFWLGVMWAVLGCIVAPPLVAVFLPKYVPAMPVFLLLLATLPLYGPYKMMKSTLVVFRQQHILAVRIVTETIGIIILDVVLLPLLGVIGAALELVVMYVWRVRLTYAGLRRVEFGLPSIRKMLFRFDRDDRELLGKIFQFIVLKER